MTSQVPTHKDRYGKGESRLRLTAARLPEHVRLPMDSPIQDKRTALSRRAGEDAPIALTHQCTLARSGRHYSLTFFDASLRRGSEWSSTSTLE